MYEEFSDKVVFITGGSTGIGKTTAEAFSRWAARVIICARNSNKAEPLLYLAQQQSWQLKYMQADVANSENIKAVISHIIQYDGSLDSAFNNADVDGELCRIADYSIEGWQKTIAINLSGVFYCLKYEIEQMLKQTSGAIINYISVSGHKGYPGDVGYISNKHGLTGLTKAASMEYADKNIRINGISPGVIRTPMTDKDRDKAEDYKAWIKKVEPMKRIGEPHEVTETVL
ncbi:MAG: SDR family NAD(P)-dependent oxidoreductase [Candidatus Cloacimonadota bacterium]|nr:SDR family NAD(P)-dependent oxidoreductase [Candidatus Cloacimonadota bacterium]